MLCILEVESILLWQEYVLNKEGQIEKRVQRTEEREVEVELERGREA